MSCPACGAELAPWRTVPGGEPADPARYTLERCRECGTGATVEHPAADAYATGTYRPDAPRLAQALRALKRALSAQIVGMLRRAGLAKGARVLDAGAGSGLLVGRLRDEGFDAYGIEPSPRGGALVAASATPVRAEAIERHTAEGLDAVVLWHVLEHLDDPAAALRTVRAWLRPGGVVVVGAPNLTSLQAAIAGDRWFHLDAPRHRAHFSRRGLSALLGRCGFEVVAERHLVAEHNLHGMWFALLTRLGMSPGFPFHLLKRNAPRRARDFVLVFLAGPVVLVPAVALELLATALRRGGTVAVVATAQESA